MENNSILAEIIKAQTEVLSNAPQIQETKFTNSTRGRTGIFEYMKAKDIPFSNTKYFPSYHLVIRNPRFKYEYDPKNCMTGQDGWYARYRKLVLMYLDAEALNIESIRDSIYPEFCEDLSEWAETLTNAVLSHFNADNTSEYEKFKLVFSKPLKMKMKELGMPCPQKPNLEDIIYLDRDPEAMEQVKKEVMQNWLETYCGNTESLREMYRHNYEITDFAKSDSISKPGGLIEAAKNWVNPFFNKEEEVVDNGVKRCDSDGFHAVTTPATKHAGGRPVKMDYLKGAPDEMVNTVLDGFGFSKQQKFYFRKRLGNNSTRKKGRPCKYAGMTEEQIRAKMMSEGKSKHDIAQQIRRNKKVKEAPQKGEQKVIGTQKNEGTKSNTFR